MSEPQKNTEDSQEETDEQKLFEDIKGNTFETYKGLYKKASATNSIPELVRAWADNTGYFKTTKEDLNDSFLIKVSGRTSKLIRYVNGKLHKDTDNYKGDSRDLPLHRDLIAIAADMESNWNNIAQSENERKKVLDKIDERIKKYKEDKPDVTF